VNLGKNKNSPADSIEDFLVGVKSFAPYSDALVINVSSPNTPGLRFVNQHDRFLAQLMCTHRSLQNRKQLEDILQGVTKARDQAALSTPTSRKPRLLLKIAPDLEESQLVDIADVVKKSAIDGVIVSNTTVYRPPSLLGC
jgi:dihydroorotate dehydrogenase